MAFRASTALRCSDTAAAAAVARAGQRLTGQVRVAQPTGAGGGQRAVPPGQEQSLIKATESVFLGVGAPILAHNNRGWPWNESDHH
jgi:hypothetical protein